MLSEAGVDLLNRLLTYDPDKRITARQALRHAYFSERPLPRLPQFMPSFPSGEYMPSFPSGEYMPFFPSGEPSMKMHACLLPAAGWHLWLCSWRL